MNTDQEELIDVFAKQMVLTHNVNEDDDKFILQDGSRCILTLRAPVDNDDDDDTTTIKLVDNVHLSLHSEFGMRWMTARDVSGGTLLYEETPLVYVSFLDDNVDNPLQKRVARKLLPQKPVRAATIQRLYNGERELAAINDDDDEDFTPSPDWTMTYLYMTRNEVDDVRKQVSQMRQPGTYARVHEIRTYLGERNERRQELAAAAAEEKDELQRKFDENEMRFAEDRRYIEAILRGTQRRGRKYTVDEILTVYGVVFRNSMYMRSAISQAIYGVGLYPGSVYMQHACSPTAHVYFGEDGRIRIEAAGPMPAGTHITIDRLLNNQPLIRCIALAPAWIRRAADARTGAACSCSECSRALMWMRAQCSSNNNGQGGGGGGELTEDVIQAVISAVESTWTDPDNSQTPEFTEVVKNSDEVDTLNILFAEPMMLTSVTNGATIVSLFDASTLQREFTNVSKLSLRTLQLARFTLEMAARNASTFLARFGGAAAALELIEVAGTYETTHGLRLLHGKLREQGSTFEFIQRRSFEYLSRTQYSRFAAKLALRTCMIFQKEIDPTKRRTLIALEFKHNDQYTDQMNAVLKFLVSSAALSASEADTHTWTAAADRLRFELMQAPIVALAVQNLSLS